MLRAELLRIAGWQGGAESVYLARERHLIALRAAEEHLMLAAQHADQNAQALDLFAEELRLAQDQLNSITGEFTSDDLWGLFLVGFVWEITQARHRQLARPQDIYADCGCVNLLRTVGYLDRLRKENAKAAGIEFVEFEQKAVYGAKLSFGKRRRVQQFMQTPAPIVGRQNGSSKISGQRRPHDPAQYVRHHSRSMHSYCAPSGVRLTFFYI